MTHNLTTLGEKAAYIRAFFDGEGSVSGYSKKYGRNHRRITISNTEKSLLLKIQKWLDKDFGIKAKIYCSQRKKKVNIINGKEYIYYNRKLYSIKFWGRERLIKFNELIGSYHPEKIRRLKEGTI